MYWWHHLGAAVVVPEGVLNALSYGRLRTAIVKAAVDEPRAVIVDVDRMRVDRMAALALFPAVATELATWPGLSLLLVAAEPASQQMLTEYRMQRLLPVHYNMDAAAAAIGAPPPRQVARTVLPNGYASLRLARAFVRRCCFRWQIAEDRTVDAIWVANELVENTIKHTYGPPSLRVELRRDLLTVAVQDSDPAPAVLREADPENVMSGLAVVDHLCRNWGSNPTPAGGKVVWAVL